MIKIERILIDYQENPIGHEAPRQLGWVMKADEDEKDVVQQAYQIQIAGKSDFETLLYDSKKVESEESAHITFPQLSIASSTKYFIRIKAWTNKGETPWHESFFVTALLHREELVGSFITIETKADAKDARGSYVRRQIGINKKLVAAYAHTTALGLYHFYINGEKIGTDEFAPGWTSYHNHLLYQTHDVTQYLKKGDNVLGAMLGAGWYKGTMGFKRLRNHYGEETAFYCQLVLCYEDGTREEILSDKTWEGTWSPILFSEIYDGEIYDAGKEIAGWCTSIAKGEDWQRVHTVNYDKGVMQPQSGAKTKIINTLPAIDVLTTPKGETVLDFGQNLTGFLEFQVQGNVRDKVEIRCFEVLDSKGNAYFENLRSAKETLIYYVKGENLETYHPYFSFQGFRYAKIVSYPGKVRKENFTAYAVHSDMKETGSFYCSNKDINQLQHNILWGMKGNFLDVPTDCPQRDERLGWTGDAQIFCRTASYLMDTYSFYRKWLVDVAADSNEAGAVPHVVPDIVSNKVEGDWLLQQGTYGATAWADVITILPWTLYLTYGDKNILEERYMQMKGWIDFMTGHATNGIWNFELQFGDWVALDAKEGSYFGATPNDLTCTAYYAYSTEIFVKTAKVLGRTEDANVYETLYKEIVDSYRRHFFDENGHMSVQTQTAQILSLYFNLVKEEDREKVTQDLLKLLENEKGHLVTGFVGTPYFCHALSENGHTKEAYELLLKDDFPSWLYQVKQGATTIWEHWDGLKPNGTMWSPDMNSFNHYAYGAVGEWMYRKVAGIDIDEENPGYKHSVIAPHIGGNLRDVAASYESVYGRLSVSWQRKDGELLLKVSVPVNTTATITVPGINNEEKNVGSGDYVFSYTVEND